VLNNLGCALKALGLLEDAIIAFNDSLAIQPTADAAVNLVVLHIETGDIDNARHLIRSSKRIIPSNEMKQIKNFYKEVKRSERKPVNPAESRQTGLAVKFAKNLITKKVTSSTTKGGARRTLMPNYQTRKS
jgi:hypothetical protein